MLQLYDLNENETDIARSVVNEALRIKGMNADDVDIDITIVDNETIKQLNRDYRGIDQETDVLTFPSIDIVLPFQKDDYLVDVNPETGAVMLGEIIISRKVMQANAEEYGHGVIREFAFLVTHGMMHLFGYDHIKEKDRSLMRENEEIVLERLGYVREKD